MVKEIQVYNGDGVPESARDWIELCQADLARHLISLAEDHGDHYATLASRVLNVAQDGNKVELEALCFHAAHHPTACQTLRTNIRLATAQLFKAVEEL